MWRVGRKIRDKRLLKLIGRYLRTGVLVDQRLGVYRIRTLSLKAKVPAFNATGAA